MIYVDIPTALFGVCATYLVPAGHERDKVNVLARIPAADKAVDPRERVCKEANLMPLQTGRVDDKNAG
jgi:hypothetical protein